LRDNILVRVAFLAFHAIGNAQQPSVLCAYTHQLSLLDIESFIVEGLQHVPL
jgi:hypothetical protein